MKKYHLYITILALALCLPLVARAQSAAPQLGKDPIPDIIKAMTLQQKATLVVGVGFPGLNPTVPGAPLPKKNPTIAGHTNALAKFGIPSVDMSDGPAGVHRYVMTHDDSVNNRFATAWPVGTLLASSWDTALVHKVGETFGKEVKAYGIDFILGPAANIHRNPLGGRNFEYYSEDPLLSGKIAGAMINGLQSRGIGATLKHFVANNQETNRNTLNTIVSERAMREIYLRSFEIAIKDSHPWAVMSSYNLVNGTYTSESHALLTTILRNEWGYKGFVMTDWFGGKDPVAQMKAGNNLLMPGTQNQVTAIVNAVKNGRLKESVLDKNVAGILKGILRTPTFKKYRYSNHVDLMKDAEVSREAADGSMILLKNDHDALPISDHSKTVSLFGNHAYDLIACGTGSGAVNQKFAISLEQGLTNAGYTVDKDVQQLYTTYLSDYRKKHPKKPGIQELINPTPLAPEYGIGQQDINTAALHSDVGIVYIGREAGEGKDRKIADDYDLSAREKQTIDEVSAAFHAQHKPVIAVLNIGGVINVTSFRDKADAILLAWQPGEEGGNAMADILSGKVDPSGKLATTFPMKYDDEPSAKNFPGKSFPDKATRGLMGQPAIPGEVTYKEGIYVGYRYFNTFHVKPAYEFGYGLSYTTFSFSPVTLSSSTFRGELNARVTVTNTGKTAGKEVAELYLSAPRGNLDKPSEELKGFAKTASLEPGKSQTVTFTLKQADLASFDTKTSSWIAAPGTYTVKIGASSLDIKSTATFKLPKELVVEKDHRVLTPNVKIDELKSPAN